MVELYIIFNRELNPKESIGFEESFCICPIEIKNKKIDDLTHKYEIGLNPMVLTFAPVDIMSEVIQKFNKIYHSKWTGLIESFTISII